MPPLLVVTGPPGAGKSTVAHLVTDRFERSALVEGEDVADQIVAAMADGSLRHEVRAP
jgi:adenylate kinase family enzyme